MIFDFDNDPTLEDLNALMDEDLVVDEDEDDDLDLRDNEDDGQPSEYDEWQDLYGGDDSIYEHDCDCMFDN
jgi:hypothetical protein